MVAILVVVAGLALAAHDLNLARLFASLNSHTMPQTARPATASPAVYRLNADGVVFRPARSKNDTTERSIAMRLYGDKLCPIHHDGDIVVIA
jgi:hypothetical protein